MKPYDVIKMMGQLKKAQIEKVVQCGFEDGALYNDELLKLSEVDLKEFKNLKGIIGKTKSMPKVGDIDINKQGFTNEEYEEVERLAKKKSKELTEREKKLLEVRKEKKLLRDEAISILRGISIRMPLLIYGADIKDEAEEITIDNFDSRIDPQSWEEFMPKGVTKRVFNRFKKYYEPDVFREAGKRIREMARAADKFTIEERIERISAIFNTFRNPDKETVLTPWDVVNRHMSDCLGGYCFYDEEFKNPIHIPRYVDKGKVSADVFRPESHILEINSKSGLYPLYVAYSVYRARVEAAKAKYGEVNHAFAMSLWDATIEENIFVICKTPMAKSITKRTLVGFRDTRVNALCFKDLIKNVTIHPELVANAFRDGKRFWKNNDNSCMKFDAIVGNPPYNLKDGGNKASSKPIYQHFVKLAKNINPNYISIITPAKWFNGGKGLDEYRNEMLSDSHISHLYDYIDGHDCFSNVDIAGGVCYFLWDGLKIENTDCNVITHFKGRKIENIRPLNATDVFIRHIDELSILEKISNESEFLQVYPRKPFGLATNVQPLEEGDIILRYSGGRGFYKSELVPTLKEQIGKWKVITSRLTAEHAGETDKNGQKRIISTLEVLEPNVICTETYLLMATFDTKEEAENMLSYIKTRFVRCLIGMITSTQQLSRTNFRFVPLQDFTKPWTDEELYVKYGLTEEEIAFIESMIKPME